MNQGVLKIYYDFLASLDTTSRHIHGWYKKIIESGKTINHLGVCDVLHSVVVIQKVWLP